jgi:hypothetical protein
MHIYAYAWPCCGHLIGRPTLQSAVASRVPAPAADTPNRCTQLAAIKQAASAAGKRERPDRSSHVASEGRRQRLVRGGMWPELRPGLRARACSLRLRARPARSARLAQRQHRYVASGARPRSLAPVPTYLNSPIASHSIMRVSRGRPACAAPPLPSRRPRLPGRPAQLQVQGAMCRYPTRRCACASACEKVARLAKYLYSYGMHCSAPRDPTSFWLLAIHGDHPPMHLITFICLEAIAYPV